MDTTNGETSKKDIQLKEPLYRINGLDLLINHEKYQGSMTNRYRLVPASSTVNTELADEEDHQVLSLEKFKEKMIHEIIQFTPENTSRYDFTGHILFLLWKDWINRENT